MERSGSYSRLPSGSILEIQDRSMTFELRGTTRSFVQALARIIASECKGKGRCRRCSVEFRLFVKCDAKTLDVTSKDLFSSDSAVVPFDFHDATTGGTVIMKLRRGQILELMAIARKGMGKDHEKWSPATTASYFSPAEVRINEKIMETLTFEQKKEWVATCLFPRFEIDPSTQKVVLSHPEDYIDDEEVIWKAEAMGKPGLVQLSEKNDTFIFTVKTTGALKASDLVMNAMEILEQRLHLLHSVEDNCTDDQSAGSTSDMHNLDQVD
ncbi:DNA-directed RNA polymerases II, IV and V subunit 3-like [Senna tora]|uniref:DNA-directed RNA polymerases II, IV and V subunit 3-like n=1 Tax=Senna tora TaxID=362788 RepID=A0A835CIY8_9FABA|nr:DNA-directed RNA polymerases II, IV and V subunit 3-like [Senna tora]